VLKEEEKGCILNVECQEDHAGGKDIVVKAITITALFLLPLAHTGDGSGLVPHSRSSTKLSVFTSLESS
jgi:hypothetical protein